MQIIKKILLVEIRKTLLCQCFITVVKCVIYLTCKTYQDSAGIAAFSYQAVPAAKTWERQHLHFDFISILFTTWNN